MDTVFFLFGKLPNKTMGPNLSCYLEVDLFLKLPSSMICLKSQDVEGCKYSEF